MKARHLTTLLIFLAASSLLWGCSPQAPKETPAPPVTAEAVTTSTDITAEAVTTSTDITAEAVTTSTDITAEAVTTSTDITVEVVTTPTAEAVIPFTQTPEVGASAAEEPDGIDRLLEMRNVKITLTVDREGDGLRVLAAEIDAEGNQRILNTSSGAESDIPAEMYVGFDAVQQEVLVSGGQAYRKDGEEGVWTRAPELDDYLERSLRGSEGPGLWLKLLEGGTRDARVNQAGGPYSVERYTLTNTVDIETVTGDIWINISNNALVEARLEVPGVLYTHSNGGVHYPVIIEMKVEPAEVEPVKLP